MSRADLRPLVTEFERDGKVTMSRSAETFPYIVMLVPHEPDVDPRVTWVTNLCGKIARTDVLATVYAADKPYRTIDGNVYTERGRINELNSMRVALTSRIGVQLTTRGPGARYAAKKAAELEACSKPAAATNTSFLSRWRNGAESIAGALIRGVGHRMTLQALMQSVNRLARAVSLPPRLVICHDVFALAAAIDLKRRFGSRVIYDSHEYWPEADLLSTRFDRARWRRYEGKYIREADVVVTVTPQIATSLKKLYGLNRVLAVPNAEPLRSDRLASVGDGTGRLVFLAQGQVHPARGYAELLEFWQSLNVSPDVAVLQLRIPDDPYLRELQARFAGAVETRQIEFVAPVPETELVAKAATADVGIIPYPPHNANHRYCCPNKLSQYFQAGLAVLANHTEFVADILHDADAGWTYRSGNAADFQRTVREILADRTALRQKRRNARRYADEKFHWDRVSTCYREAIEELLTTDSREVA